MNIEAIHIFILTENLNFNKLKILFLFKLEVMLQLPHLMLFLGFPKKIKSINEEIR